MSALTPETEAAIRERVEKATPGPWREDGPWWHDHDEATVVITADVDRAAVCIQPPLHARRGPASDADMEFIAHAREDVPALLAALDAERAKMARAVEREFDAWEAGCELGYTAGALGVLPPPNPYGGDDAE